MYSQVVFCALVIFAVCQVLLADAKPQTQVDPQQKIGGKEPTLYVTPIKNQKPIPLQTHEAKSRQRRGFKPGTGPCSKRTNKSGLPIGVEPLQTHERSARAADTPSSGGSRKPCGGT